MTYESARRDFEYLETLAELEDQVELDSMRLGLMQNPTKKFAADMYEAAIRLWIRENLDDFITNDEVQRIADEAGY